MLLRGQNGFYQEIKKFLYNKKFLTVAITIIIATFGFTITHFSMGIDDFGAYHYMNLSSECFGNMLQQGRLIHIIFYKVVGLADVNPFVNNFIAVLLFAASGVGLCALIKMMTENVFKMNDYIIFFGLYVSCSITSYKFIYDIDVVVTMLSYLTLVGAIYFIEEFTRKKKMRYAFLSNVCLIIAISSYESFIMVYVCEVVFLLILCYVLFDLKTKEVFIHGIRYAINLVVATGIYYTIVKILQGVTNNHPYERSLIFNLEDPISAIKSVIRESFFTDELFFVKELFVFVIIFIAIMLIVVVWKRKWFSFLLFPLVGVAVMFVPIIHASAHFRTYQPVPVFVACTALLLLMLFRNKCLKRILWGTMSIVILWQILDMNKWFYKDWVNYEKNVYAIHKIATDLHEQCEVDEKPVVFVNRNYDSYLQTWDEGVQYEVGESPLIASVAFLGNTKSQAVIQMFEYQGYHFLLEPTTEQYSEAREYSKNMPMYPKEGYIVEKEDYIIVNLGKAN